jgi:hypothetical protein
MPADNSTKNATFFHPVFHLLACLKR